jgi:dipeptidyl aminopeptidase/acylaminoacyl peptidase
VPRYDFARFLNVRNAYSPSPSPDGSRVAFLSDITGVPQVWSVPVEGGWPEQLTFYAERVATVEYSPAGDRILFGMDAGGNERQGLYSVSPDGAEVQPLAVAEDVIHSWGAWSPDGSQIAYASNARDRRYFDVYVRPLDGEPRCVLQQDGTNSVVGWSPDGRSLLVSRTREMYSDTDLYLLDLASGEARLLTEHEGEAYHGSPHFIGEDTVLLIASRDREFAAPARLDLRTGELRYLAETEWDAEELAASADGRVVAYTVNEEGYSRLRLEVGGEPRTVAALPDGVIVGLKLSEDGSTLVFAHYGATRNGNVWAVDTASGEARQVTHATRAGLPDEALAEPRLVRYPTFDGREVPAFLYLPRDVEPPVPVVVHVHGGPEGQARPTFNPTIQYLVNLGLGVLATNVRGSTGYGKTFAHLDDVRKRMDSVADLEAAVRWLRESGIGRPDAIAVMGGSYGGFMTLAAITTYPDLWAAAVDTVGIANFVTFLEQTGPWRRTLREVEYGSLERDRDFLEAISPINHVDKITAPLLVIHGANDPRVPIGEAEQIVASLQARGREVDYLRFEDEGHGLVKLPNRIRAAERTAAFLEQHLARA